MVCIVAFPFLRSRVTSAVFIGAVLQFQLGKNGSSRLAVALSMPNSCAHLRRETSEGLAYCLTPVTLRSGAVAADPLYSAGACGDAGDEELSAQRVHSNEDPLSPVAPLNCPKPDSDQTLEYRHH